MTETVDILFINPGDRRGIYQDLGDEFCAIEPPVLAGLFATYARNKGAKVAVIDGPAWNMSASEIAEQVTNDYITTLVAITVYGSQPSASTQNMTAAGTVSRAIKELAPDIPILMTGTHPAALPAQTMQEEAIDFVCDREGPVTIYKTMLALNAGQKTYSDIPSLWWRDEDTIMSPVKSESLIVNLDAEMPNIAHDLLPMNNYRAHNWHSFDNIQERSPYAAIHTSLGCPYSCSFCCINAPYGKASYRMWHPKSVVAEIDTLVGNYGVKNIKIVDEMFVLNKRHVIGICDHLIDRDYKINVWAYARVDTVQEEYLDKLKKAGFNWICLGIESASKHVRDGAMKMYNNKDIIEVVRRIQDAGINVLGNYIFGLPDDTHETMQETLDLALELNCEFANFYSAMAYPGSKLYNNAEINGIDLPNHWQDYSQHGYGTKPIPSNHCSSADILEFRDKAWNTYFDSAQYHKLIRTKFGQEVVDHINRMAALSLKRRLLEKPKTASK